MDSKPPPKLSEIEKSLRDVAISRRGGVRTRGGRLPPIRMRDLSQASASTSKKVVAPKIPQRRIKKEPEQRTDFSAEDGLIRRLDPSPGGGGRRGGDGRRVRPARAVLQTGGSFLAEGPAARIKKDVSGLDLGFSMPRSSAIKEEASAAAKYDAGMIRDVMDSYEANQFYLDAIGEIPPYRLPLLKKETHPQIKSEIDEDGDNKVEIKKEFAEDDDDTTKLKSDVKTSLEYFKDVEREGLLVLLKLPTPSPFAKTTAKDTDSKEEKADGKEIQDEEGLIGKLRFMRSGRMRLVLGDVNLELEDDVPSESYTEAACIRVSEEGGAADLIVLGKVDRSMVLNPILGNLVDEESTSYPSCSRR